MQEGETTGMNSSSQNHGPSLNYIGAKPGLTLKTSRYKSTSYIAQKKQKLEVFREHKTPPRHSLDCQANYCQNVENCSVLQSQETLQNKSSISIPIQITTKNISHPPYAMTNILCKCHENSLRILVIM